MKTVSLITVFMCALAMAGCSHARSTGSASYPASGPSFDAYMSAFNAHDADALGALYTEDAVMLPPNAERLDGRTDIRAFWQGAFDAGFTNIVLTSTDLQILGRTAVDLGTFTIDAPDGGDTMQTHAGKYLVVWAYGMDGVWRIDKDIWNDDPPAAN